MGNGALAVFLIFPLYNFQCLCLQFLNLYTFRRILATSKVNELIDREPGWVILAKRVTNAEVYGNVIHGSQYKEIDLCRTPAGGLRCGGYENDTPKLG